MTLDTTTNARPEALFTCPICGRPVLESDYFELGMRPPDPGETRDEYCDAELVDEIQHAACVLSAPSTTA